MGPHFLRSLTLDPPGSGDEDRYPFNVPALSGLKDLPLHPGVTLLIGENGSGKSTLLEAIAEKLGFGPEGGSRTRSTSHHEGWSALATRLRLTRSPSRPMDGFFLRAESFIQWADELDRLESDPWTAGALRSYGGQSLNHQSHGESFLSLLNHRLGGHGIYLFDEPEAALSPQHQLSLIVRMHDLVRESSQFIIATHSPFLMAYPHAWIYEFSASGLKRVAFEETEHFRISRAFFNNPQGMMRELLRREGELDLDDP